MRLALWLSVCMLVAAALLGGFFIIVGDQSNVGGRAWLTLLLVGAFTGAILLDANVGNGPNRWYLAASTITNAVLIAIGLLKIWNGWLQPSDTADAFVWSAQLLRFFGVILLLRVALLITQLYGLHFIARAKSTATRVSGIATLIFVWLTALLLAIPAAFPAIDWPDWWWRSSGATALVGLVVAVIPVLVRAFEPKPPKPVLPFYGPPQPYGTAPGYLQQGHPQQGYPQQGYYQQPPAAPIQAYGQPVQPYGQRPPPPAAPATGETLPPPPPA
jgi:hypothetical protein